jgi:RND family efflux transporter MFP subunit
MERALPVGAEIAMPAPVTRILALNGRIAAAQSVGVRSGVTGTLTGLFVAEGDVVQADQVLAQVDAAAQSAVVRQAVAALDAALEAEVQARETYDRAVSLGRNVARTVLTDAGHALQSASQQVARLRAGLDQARAVLDTYTIRAPVAGTVVDLDADQGQIVGPSTPLLTLADLDDLLVEADVDEAHAIRIAVGQPAVLHLSGEALSREGRVSFVSTRVNVSTGGLAVRMAFDEEMVTAPIGLTVTANIIVDRFAAALTVPRTAIAQGANGPQIFVIADGTAQPRDVAVRDWPAARLIVTSGLAEGDVVITDAQGITDGQAVSADLP